MDDPVGQMQKLTASQGSKQENEAARTEWLKRIPGFAAYAQKIIAPLKETQGVQTGVVSEEEFRIWFDRRILRFQGGFEFEKGAEASFEVCNDGKLRGYRAPACLDGVRVTRQEFVCLGEPATITDEALRVAIADFLEWGVAGEGRSRVAAPHS
jgi:hypothetical protein